MFYRMHLPLAELARHDGYEVTFADAGDRHGPPSVTLSMLDGHDVIVAQRWNTHKGLEVWRRARTPYTRTVYELDDDVFSITPENFAAWQLYNRPDVRDAIEHAVQTADLITVSTEPLGEVLRELNPAVAVLPNCIPAWVLDLPPRPPRDRPAVGWTGGASHGVDIGVVAGPVRRFLRRFGGWDFQLNATDYRRTFTDAGVPPDRMSFRPWVQVNEYPREFYQLADYDIGLAPLWPTPFSRAKSAVKALEHAARGIPTIASDCPAYRPVIEHGVNGFLVRHEHEWLKYLSELAGDDGLRAKMGQAAREMAARHTIEEHWGRWAAAYEGLFRR